MRLGASVIIGGGLLFGLLADTPAQESSGSVSGEAIAPIERRIPPEGGITLEDEVREALENRVVDLSDRVWEIDFKEDVADVGALVKAVDLALRHGEFYKPEDVELATELLDLAEEPRVNFGRLENAPERDAQLEGVVHVEQSVPAGVTQAVHDGVLVA